MSYYYGNTKISDLLQSGNSPTSSYGGFGSYTVNSNTSTTTKDGIQVTTYSYTGTRFTQGHIGYQVSGTDLGPTFLSIYNDKVGTDGNFVGPNSDQSGYTSAVGNTVASIDVSYAVPNDCHCIRGILIGGGGSGGSGQNGGDQHCGGGGGSGAGVYFSILKSDLLNIQNIAISVGGGANGATGSGNTSSWGSAGGAGGDTYLYYNTNTSPNTNTIIITAGGGKGGSGTSNATPSPGGAGGTVTINPSYTDKIFSTPYNGTQGESGNNANTVAYGKISNFPNIYELYPVNIASIAGTSGYGGIAPSNSQGNGGGQGYGGRGRIYFLTETTIT